MVILRIMGHLLIKAPSNGDAKNPIITKQVQTVVVLILPIGLSCPNPQFIDGGGKFLCMH